MLFSSHQATLSYLQALGPRALPRAARGHALAAAIEAGVPWRDADSVNLSTCTGSLASFSTGGNSGDGIPS